MTCGRRKPWLALFTGMTVGGTALLWFVRPEPAYVLPCLVLIALTNVTFELANVFFYARVRQELGQVDYRVSEKLWVDFDQEHLMFFPKTIELSAKV